MSAMITAAAITAAAGLYSANQNRKAQQGALNSQLGAQNSDLAFRQQLYQDERDFSQPIRDQLKDQALQDGPLDYGPMKDQITQQYGLAKRNLETQMAQRGLTGSGLDAGATRGMMLRQAGDLSKAYQQGLINKRQLALALLGHDQRLQAGGLVGQGYQNLASTYGNYAGMYGQAAQQGYGTAASALANGLYLYELQNRGNGAPPAPSGSPAAPLSVSSTPSFGVAPAMPVSSASGTVPNLSLGLTPQTVPATGGSEWGAGSDWKPDW